jgi:transposase
VLAVTPRRDRLDAHIEQIAAAPLVRRLGCLRRIGTLTGLALAVEIGDCNKWLATQWSGCTT